jgi:hypothetical protein
MAVFLPFVLKKIVPARPLWTRGTMSQRCPDLYAQRIVAFFRASDDCPKCPTFLPRSYQHEQFALHLSPIGESGLSGLSFTIGADSKKRCNKRKRTQIC